jgi:hypothetical protein
MLNLSIFDRQASNFKEWLSSVNIMNVSFDTMLKSVRLPDLQCQGDSPCTELHHGLRNPGEAPPLFNYLRLKHKVAEIFEIIVPDCPIHPHSNDAIRTSLNGFRVRHLDWRKKDLSLETVNRAAPNLESLCLYSSGNADVLGHWASVNGLGRFKEVSQNRHVFCGILSIAISCAILLSLSLGYV